MNLVNRLEGEVSATADEVTVHLTDQRPESLALFGFN
jgi:hypothetical protein